MFPLLLTSKKDKQKCSVEELSFEARHQDESITTSYKGKATEIIYGLIPLDPPQGSILSRSLWKVGCCGIHSALVLFGWKAECFFLPDSSSCWSLLVTKMITIKQVKNT